MQPKIKADVVIIGGGIAGLWTLTRLRQAGYAAILLESGTLGGGQTHKAQGIIHGGMKYVLQGALTGAFQAMANVPQFWRQCLKGQGNVNLSRVALLAPCHYLFAPTKLGAKMAAFFASAALTSKITPLAKDNYPAVFKYPEFKGEIYSLDEIVLDVHALITELVAQNADAILQIDELQASAFHYDAQGHLQTLQVHYLNDVLEIAAKQFVFTAGAGNNVILKQFPESSIAMQLRPLHMVMVKSKTLPSLFAHCLGLSAKPRLTITSHQTKDGELVWYLGGKLAEDGITKDRETQIKATQQELRALFPWFDMTQASYATFMIDRAEVSQYGVMPDSTYVKSIKNMLIAWPTKLALAPRLADDIVHMIAKNLKIQTANAIHLINWPKPAIAQPIWETAFC